jgi:hypothetical protein
VQLNNEIAHEEVTQGKYQVSIGTSLALETLFGINDNIPPTDPLPYKQYSYVLINLRTLVRNMYGAVQKELKTEWSAGRYYEKVLKELEMIPLILEDQSHGKLSAVYYLPSYRSVEKEYPHAILKTLGKKAYGRQHYEAIEQYCVAQLNAAAIRGEQTIAMVDTSLPPIDQKSVIVTHMPIDLLSYINTDQVDLIETHTGVIKPRRMWYTKLNGKGLERIPFKPWSLQWFGDGKTFSGMPPKYRSAVLEFAEKNHWNQTTTEQLIKAQMNRFPDKEIRAELLKFL